MTSFGKLFFIVTCLLTAISYRPTSDIPSRHSITHTFAKSETFLLVTSLSQLINVNSVVHCRFRIRGHRSGTFGVLVCKTITLCGQRVICVVFV